MKRKKEKEKRKKEKEKRKKKKEKRKKKKEKRKKKGKNDNKILQELGQFHSSENSLDPGYLFSNHHLLR